MKSSFSFDLKDSGFDFEGRKKNIIWISPSQCALEFVRSNQVTPASSRNIWSLTLLRNQKRSDPASSSIDPSVSGIVRETPGVASISLDFD